MTVPLLGVFFVQQLGFSIVYMSAKFDDSIFNGSRDIFGGPKI